MTKIKGQDSAKYYDINKGMPIKIPRWHQTFISRLALPVLSLVSREKALDLGLIPIDDERVIMALKNAKGRALDVGCGANSFIRSYGNGIGVDVFNWAGCDKVVKDTSKLPFKKGEFDTVSFLACLNHIPNRGDALKEANRVMGDKGVLLVTMITPRWGKFIHWIRFRNDPDHQDRHIDHDHELLGMSAAQIKQLLDDSGFRLVKRKRFVFGLNSLYVATKV